MQLGYGPRLQPACPQLLLTGLLHADDKGNVPLQRWVVVLRQVLLTTALVALLWRGDAALGLIGLAKETFGLGIEDLGRGQALSHLTRCEQKGCCQHL